MLSHLDCHSFCFVFLVTDQCPLDIVQGNHYSPVNLILEFASPTLSLSSFFGPEFFFVDNKSKWNDGGKKWRRHIFFCSQGWLLVVLYIVLTHYSIFMNTARRYVMNKNDLRKMRGKWFSCKKYNPYQVQWEKKHEISFSLVIQSTLF